MAPVWVSTTLVECRNGASKVWTFPPQNSTSPDLQRLQIAQSTFQILLIPRWGSEKSANGSAIEYRKHVEAFVMPEWNRILPSWRRESRRKNPSHSSPSTCLVLWSFSSLLLSSAQLQTATTLHIQHIPNVWCTSFNLLRPTSFAFWSETKIGVGHCWMIYLLHIWPTESMSEALKSTLSNVMNYRDNI